MQGWDNIRRGGYGRRLVNKKFNKINKRFIINEQGKEEEMENKELSEGMKIKIARVIKGYSQRELAEKSGVSYRVVNEFENGKRDNVRPSKLKKIKETLGIDEEENGKE